MSVLLPVLGLLVVLVVLLAPVRTAEAASASSGPSLASEGPRAPLRLGIEGAGWGSAHPVLVSEEERARRRLRLQRLTHVWLATGVGATLGSLTVFVLARLSILVDSNPHDDGTLRGQPIAIAGLTLMSVFATATVAALFFLAFQRSESRRREARAWAPVTPDPACACLRF